MQQASGHHRQDRPADAADDQQRAVEDLERALEEIERALAQLREEEREEILAALEARFREILERHRPVTATTVELETLKAERPWTRADVLRLADVAAEEAMLADLVQAALDILVEDGTTVIFPRIVGQLRDDMWAVHGLLEAERTDAYTQGLEREIEQTLEELIAALERARQESQAEQAEEGQSQSPPEALQPLVPGSAELKLLKFAQERVNRRTAAFDEARPPGPLDAMMQGRIEALTRRQKDVAEMTLEMLDRR